MEARFWKYHSVSASKLSLIYCQSPNSSQFKVALRRGTVGGPWSWPPGFRKSPPSVGSGEYENNIVIRKWFASVFLANFIPRFLYDYWSCFALMVCYEFPANQSFQYHMRTVSKRDQKDESIDTKHIPDIRRGLIRLNLKHLLQFVTKPFKIADWFIKHFFLARQGKSIDVNIVAIAPIWIFNALVLLFRKTEFLNLPPNYCT